jgi:hypothetical protein
VSLERGVADGGSPDHGAAGPSSGIVGPVAVSQPLVAVVAGAGFRWVRKKTTAPRTSAPSATSTISRIGELDEGIALATA